MILLFASACDIRDSGEAATTLARDSAGIHIVENRSPAWTNGDSWTIDPHSVLQIGVLEGREAYQFTSIWRATRRSDGVIALVDRGGAEVRIFGSEGEHIQTIGREGEGPGEFGSLPEILWVAPDTLLTWDARLRRLTWFDRGGNVVRERSMAGAISAANMRGVVGISGAWQVLPDGAFLVSGHQTGDDGGFDRYFMRFITAEGSVASLGDYEGDQRVRVPQRVVMAHSFGPHPYAALRDQPVAIFLARTGGREITVFDSAGRVTELWRVAVPRVPITKRVLEEELSRWADLLQVTSTPAVSGLQDAFDQLSVPDSLPAIRRVFSDPVGNLWIQRRSESDPSAEGPFDVLDPNGRWFGTVEMPQDAGRVLEIGRDYILTVWYDELRVDYLRVYQVRK
jgi:hypothetical protein